MKITPIEDMVGLDPFSIIPPNNPNSPVRIDHLKAGTTKRYYHRYSTEIVIVLKGKVTINERPISEASVVSNPAGTIVNLVAETDAYVCRAHSPLLSKSDVAAPPSFVQDEVFDGPLVSVIVTAFNVDAYIGATLMSLFAQSYRNLEIVVYDDVSSDKTVEIVRSLASLDRRVRLVEGKKNIGGSLAKRAGLEAATGDYFIFCDGDDIVEPTMIAECLSTATATQADCVIFGFDHYSEERGNFFGEVLPLSGTSLGYENAIGARPLADEAFSFCKLSHISPVCFMRSDEHKAAFSNALLDIPFYYDVATFFAMLATARKVSVVNSPFYHYRIGRAGQSVEGWARSRRGMKMASLAKAYDHGLSAPWAGQPFARALMLYKAVRMAFIEVVDMMNNGRHEETILTILAFQTLVRRFSLADMRVLLRRPRFAAMAFALRWASPGLVYRLVRRVR